jgi:hypothetical protein
VNEWLSLHLFYHEINQQDRLLTEVVRPVLIALTQTGTIRQAFFVRYWQGGPHIRLRLQGNQSGWQAEAEQAVRARFGEFVRQAPSQATLSPEAFYRHLPQTESLPTPDLWNADNSVEAIPYEPEFDRYGGPLAMPVNEALFCASSNLVLGLLPALLQQPAKRTGLAIEIMLVTAHQFGVAPEDLPAYLERYGAMLRQMTGSEEDWQAEATRMAAERAPQFHPRLHSLLSGDLPTQYQRWASAVADAAAALRHLQAEDRLGRPEIPAIYTNQDPTDWWVPGIGIGHLHMTNNRLGLPLTTEGRLAFLLAAILREGR